VPTTGVISAYLPHNEVSRLAFSKAIITEIDFPELEHASKLPAFITVRLHAETVSLRFDKEVSPAPSGPPPAEPAAFSLEIPGLETTSVTKVPALVFKQSVVSDPMTGRAAPSATTVPNLVLTVPNSAGASYQSWFDNFVLGGNCGAKEEKHGSLQFLAPNRRDTLFTLNFTPLGIVQLSREVPQSVVNITPDYHVEMYCGDMILSYGNMKP
jgi:hypothetical protein